MSSSQKPSLARWAPKLSMKVAPDVSFTTSSEKDGSTARLKRQQRKVPELSSELKILTQPSERPPIFGRPLPSVPDDADLSNESVLSYYGLASGGVPWLPALLIQYLEENSFKDEGLFRIAGYHSDMKAMKEKIDKGCRSLDVMHWILGAQSTHSVAGLLKMYLRELPVPLLTFELYDCFIAANGVCVAESRIEMIRKTLGFLPRINLFLLKRLVKLLVKVAQHSETSKMNSQNLAICFAPTLLRAGSINAPVMTSSKSAGKSFTVESELITDPSLIAETAYSTQLMKTLIENCDILLADGLPNDYLFKVVKEKGGKARITVDTNPKPKRPLPPLPGGPKADNVSSPTSPTDLTSALTESPMIESAINSSDLPKASVTPVVSSMESNAVAESNVIESTDLPKSDDVVDSDIPSPPSDSIVVPIEEVEMDEERDIVSPLVASLSRSNSAIAKSLPRRPPPSTPTSNTLPFSPRKTMPPSYLKPSPVSPKLSPPAYPAPNRPLDPPDFVRRTSFVLNQVVKMDQKVLESMPALPMKPRQSFASAGSLQGAKKASSTTSSSSSSSSESNRKSCPNLNSKTNSL